MTTNKEKRRLDLIIGRNIHLERCKRNVTVEELGDALGLTISHVRLIEKGERGATATSLWKLSKFFKKPIDSFFTPSSTDEDLKPSENEVADDVSRKKIESLVSCVEGPSLGLIVHMVKGVIGMNASTESKK